MKDDNETQTDLCDEAMDNYPGGVCYSGMEGLGQRIVGGAFAPLNCKPLNEPALRQQRVALAQEQRSLLAAALLQGGAHSNGPDQWLDIAQKAVDAAAIIFPDPEGAR